MFVLASFRFLAPNRHRSDFCRKFFPFASISSCRLAGFDLFSALGRYLGLISSGGILNILQPGHLIKFSHIGLKLLIQDLFCRHGRVSSLPCESPTTSKDVMISEVPAAPVSYKRQG